MKRPILFILISLMVLGTAQGEIRKGRDGLHYSNSRTIRLKPKMRASGPASVAKIELFVSEDGGETWNLHSAIDDSEKIFSFEAAHDGRYLFATVATDSVGQNEEIPSKVDDAELDVTVDTEAPRLAVDRTRLELEARPKDLKRLFWKATDAGKSDHVLISSFDPQSRSWTEVARVADADSWVLEIPNSPWEEYRVRLQAIDAAGNAGTPEDVVFRLGPLAIQPLSNLSIPPFVRQGEVPMIMASDGFMDGEFSHYEVYYTLDEGQTWLLAGSTRQKELFWKAPRDGRYGFYSVAVSKAGTGEALPKSGDAPKARCLVDTVAPELTLDAPLGHERYSSSKPLEVVWHAAEMHAQGRQVKIEWSADDGKTWKPLADGALSGRYYWSLEGLSGHQFRLRLTLEDEAGHSITRVSERFSLGPLNSEESLELSRLFKKATTYRVLGRSHEALEAYTGILKYDANHAPTHNDMGVTMVTMKRWDEAIKCFQKASGLNPSSGEYLYNLAYSYHAQSMPELAEDAFLRLLTLDASEPRAHWYLSEIYLSRGDKPRAIEHLENVARNREGRNQLRPLAIQRLIKIH